VNSIGLISAQRPSPEGKGAPAPARWQFCEKGLGFLATWRQVLSLFRGDTDDLQKSPPILFLRRVKSTTALRATELRRAPAPADWGND
jgi:hypothetical protein